MGWVFYFLLINGLINTLGILSILSASHTPRHTHSRTTACWHRLKAACTSMIVTVIVWLILIEQQSLKGIVCFNTIRWKGRIEQPHPTQILSSAFPGLPYFLFFLNLWCISKTLELWCQHFLVHCLILVKKKKIFSCFRRIRRKFSDINLKLFHVKAPPVKERSACSILIFIHRGSRRGWWAKTLQPLQPHVRKGSCLTKLSGRWSRSNTLANI